MDYPRIAADLAAQTDDLFFGGFGVLLDYSPASILALDAFFADLYGSQGDSPKTDAYQPSTGKQKIIIGVGCYFGETLRRLFGGQWRGGRKEPGNPPCTELHPPPGSLLLVDPPFPRAEQTAGQYRAAGEMFERAGLPDIAQRFFARGPSPNRG